MKRSSFRICFKYTKINEKKSRFNEMACFLLHNKLNLGAIFNTVGRKASSMFFSVERYLDLISVKAEKIVSPHKYVVLNGRI